MKTQWEKELENISVTIEFPDGDFAHSETISDIKEFPQLKSLIKLAITKAEKRMTKKDVLDWLFKHNKKIYYQLVTSKK